MSATLNITDYFEMVMLMIGWVINNALWSSLMQSGLALIPFIALIASEWFKVRQEGEDEGNKGVLLIARIETRLYAMVVCYAFTCLPIMDLSYNPANSIMRTDGEGEQCNVAMIGKGEWDSTTLNSLGGETAKIPLWWALVHAVSKGVTNVAVSSIPCSPDLQAITSEIDAEAISDPALLQELGEFQRQCYGASRNLLFQQSGADGIADAEDVDWLGSDFFMNTPGYYDSFYAGRPIAGFPYDPDRDEARTGTGPGRPGVPSCRQWWQDESSGLYTRLHDEVSPNIWDGISSIFSSSDAEDKVIRRLISNRAGSANGNQDMSVTGYGNLDGTSVEDSLAMVAGAAGGAFGAIMGKSGMDMLKRALPMVQYILIMAIVITLPFVMTISSYSFKVAGVASFGLFAMWFLTFWWELARWINSNLVDLIYNSEAAKMSYLAAAQNGYDRLVLTFVEWSTFLILPSIWVAVLGWSGMRVGSSMSTSMTEGSKGAKGAGDKGSQMAASAATKK